MKKSVLEISAAVLMGIAALGLLTLVIQVAISGQKGAAGTMSDTLAGGLALWAVFISTKQNLNTRAILAGAIIFFALGRIVQLL